MCVWQEVPCNWTGRSSFTFSETANEPSQVERRVCPAKTLQLEEVVQRKTCERYVYGILYVSALVHLVVESDFCRY